MTLQSEVWTKSTASLNEVACVEAILGVDRMVEVRNSHLARQAVTAAEIIVLRFRPEDWNTVCQTFAELSDAAVTATVCMALGQESPDNPSRGDTFVQTQSIGGELCWASSNQPHEIIKLTEPEIAAFALGALALQAPIN